MVLYPEKTIHPSTHQPYQCLLVFPSGASPPLCLSVIAKCLLVFPSSASPPLKIWQVPACKIDMIWPTQLGFRVWHSQLSLFLFFFMATLSFIMDFQLSQKSGKTEAGRNIPWEPASHEMFKLKRIIWLDSRELISSTEGCELTRDDFL